MNRVRPLLVLLGALALLVLGGSPARAWWNSDWSFRMKVHLDTTAKGANITAPIGHAQVLIRLHAGNFNFDSANQDGSDLRVVAGDDRTPLHFEVEKYDGLVDQAALIWVDMPDLAPSAESSLFVYWGNKNAAAAGDAKATFAGSDLLVYHFAGDSGAPRDATANANNAVLGADHGTSGLIGNDAKFTGQNLVVLPKSPTLAIVAGAQMTWAMWVKPNAAAATQSAVLFTQQDGTNGFTIGLDQGVPYAEIATADGAKRAVGTAALDASTWHQLVVTAGDKLTLTLDGGKVGEVLATLPQIGAGGSLGGVVGAPGADGSAPAVVVSPYLGEIDEFEILQQVVPDGVMALWMTEKNPEKFIAFDVAEQASFFGNGYVGIIARSVTPDAWFVIGLLGVMSLVSWWTMISKALFLGRVARANATFERQYRLLSAPGAQAGAVAADMSSARTPQLRRSPLYRLYGVGMRELDARLTTGALERDGRLAPQSIVAMRAAVDAALVRESQRLGSAMVLLTICISGGPFLGLLGTVVGVMITFAAIAQAGDVNVNAIAPGVAAALLATVAGLAVAIPALFGYNYLLTRIRDASTQMNAFANELVARMAEQVRSPGDFAEKGKRSA